MTNYGNWYDNRDNDGNEDGNDDNNATSGLGSDGPIFDTITMPWYHGGGLGDNKYDTTATVHYSYMCQTIYLPYKDPIKYVP